MEQKVANKVVISLGKFSNIFFCSAATMLSKDTAFYLKICPAIDLTKLYLFFRTNFSLLQSKYDHFPNPMIEGFQDIILKISPSLIICVFITDITNIFVSVPKRQRKKSRIRVTLGPLVLV